MVSKNHLQNRIRGWLPKEPTLQTQQTSAKPKNTPIVRWTARALVAGAVADATLLVAGDLAGLTNGNGAILWQIAVFGVTLASVAAVPFLVKRKTNPQEKTPT
jgi:type IV secretory pathway TrbD component